MISHHAPFREDDKIKKMNRSLKKLKKQRLESYHDVINFMSAYNIEHCNTKKGVLRCTMRKTKKAPNKTDLEEKLGAFLNDKEKYIDKYNSQINALEQKVDSLHHINNDLTFKIDTLNQQVVKLDKEIYQQDKKIVTLKYKVNEKVNSVDSFNDDELTRFFTERYKENDSIKKTNSQTSN
mgnify:CR=1 FL=1